MKLVSPLVVACACSVVGLGCAARVASAQLVLLGDNTRANGISADGRVVVGSVGPGAVTEHAFAWTAAGGRRDFGLDAGVPAGSIANAVSGDGQFIVGESSVGAFRWSESGGFQTLGTLPFPIGAGRAFGVNGDGSVIAGWAGNTNTGPTGSFYWTQSGGMQQVPISINISPRAVGVSRDTGVVVGTAGLGDTRGFTWSPSAGTRVLQAPAGSPFPTTSASAINFDGTIVVGESTGPTVWRNEVPTLLPLPQGWVQGFSPACLSDDASVVAGVGGNLSGISQAVIWTQTRGTELFTSYLASFGIAFPTGFRPELVTGISADGMTFTGACLNPGVSRQGFVVTVPAPSNFTLVCFSIAALARRRRSP